MKTITTPPSVAAVTRTRDLSATPKGIHDDRILAVKGYGKVKIRAIRPDDEEEMVRFHQRLVQESIYMRYFEYLGLDQRTAHERLVRICKNSPDSHGIVVVELAVSKRYPAAILAVGRLTATSEPAVVTFDTLIAEQESAPHVGKVLLKQLVKLAQAFGFRILTGELLVADHDSVNLCRALGFSQETLPQDGLVRVTLDL
jgi:acetyltransferase